jgi:hypothetical protein
MVTFNKNCVPGGLLAALIFIPLFAPTFLDDKLFSLKAVLLLCVGLIILAITFSCERIAQAIEGKEKSFHESRNQTKTSSPS